MIARSTGSTADPRMWWWLQDDMIVILSDVHLDKPKVRCHHLFTFSCAVVSKFSLLPAVDVGPLIAVSCSRRRLRR
jgi:hypothetical protein